MMIGVSQGNSKRAAGWDILLFLLILSLATFHSGCAGLTKASGSGAPPSAPTVSITSPTSSATVSVSTTVSANASANTVGVQFKLDGANLGAEKTSAPFSTSWDTTTTANGQHTLIAAARNAAGQTGNSAPVSVTVQNSSGGPTVSITSPTSGATVSASATVSANVSANTVGVQFKLDGSNLGSEVTAALFSVSWDTTTTANGQHTLTAVARNAAGQTASSAPVTITVQNSSGGNPPVISGVGTGLGSTSATVFWITDKPSDSQVDYGTTASYGQSSPLDSSQLMFHSITIDGLAASTLYHYRVKSKDSVGLATSGDSTFTTLPPGAQGSLATLAASMAPGTWAQLQTLGFTTSTTSILERPLSGAGSGILEYADHGQWDTISQTVMISGGAHGDPNVPNCYGSIFIKYTASTNTWSMLPNPCPVFDSSFPQGIGHGYEHDVVVPATGNFYHRTYGPDPTNTFLFFSMFNRVTQAWEHKSVIPLGGIPSCCGSLEWFPDRGTIIHFNVRGGVINEYVPGTDTWTTLAQIGPLGVEGEGFSIYSKECHCIVMGGGFTASGARSRAIVKLNADDSVTPLNNAPIDIGITKTVSTADPVSGKILFLGTHAGPWYEYTATTDTWRLLPGVPPATIADAFTDDGQVAIPIPDYGVIMFVVSTANHSTDKVYLYKHTG